MLMMISHDLKRSAFVVFILINNIYKLKRLAVGGTTLSAFPRPLSVFPLHEAVDRDHRYGPWTNATQILYRMDPTYTPAEQFMMQQAMTQISVDMDQCIRFQQYFPGIHTGSDHIYIGKALSSGQSVPTCFSFPGRILTQSGQGQKMVLFGTSRDNGCMDTTRDVMKYFLHALGIRSEFNRPDRDKFIQVFTANVRPELQPLNLLKPYTTSQVDYTSKDFDYNSVTIPPPTKYAIPGTILFAPVSPANTFGSLARLSQGDCIGLALQYPTCKYSTCQDPYTTTPMTLTVAPLSSTTTTTGSDINNASSMLSGDPLPSDNPF